MGEGEDEGENPDLEPNLVLINESLKVIFNFSPHLNPLPPGERKKEKWEEIRICVKRAYMDHHNIYRRESVI